MIFAKKVNLKFRDSKVFQKWMISQLKFFSLVTLEALMEGN